MNICYAMPLDAADAAGTVLLAAPLKYVKLSYNIEDSSFLTCYNGRHI
ncbi:hypothetical protein [Neobacillus muris]|nr:hypothetical protein [Neobacillus muris]